MGISPILPSTCCCNFNTQFDDPTLKAQALKAGYATNEAKFESIMQIIKEAKINLLRGVDLTDRQIARYMPYTYLVSEDLDKWTQSHDSGRHYGAIVFIHQNINYLLKEQNRLLIKDY